MEVTVTLNTNREYTTDLKKRLQREKISQNQLAAELHRSPTQVSRWFTPNEKRRVTPELETVREIEEAVKRILKRRVRNTRRAETKTSTEGPDTME